MYDYVIVTHLPAFYKVNLYNELTKKLNILVVFIATNTNEKRADDFVSLENAKFKYKVLNDGDFQSRNIFENIKKLKKILKDIKYEKLLVSGWDLKEFWYLIFSNFKSTNCLALESTINESRVDSVRGLIKKIFLSRISIVFASGDLHKQLLEALSYKGEIKITKGVGIINKPFYESLQREYKKRFLYIGRLSKVKNIEILIKIFNDLPKYSLTIVGSGEEKEHLKLIARRNIIFKDPIENKKLKNEFLNNDILILSSISESWGLVVEEALYFGLPVVISENCGASELIKNGFNGYVINPNDENFIKDTILHIDAKTYGELCDGAKNFSIEEKDKNQVLKYV